METFFGPGKLCRLEAQICLRIVGLRRGFRERGRVRVDGDGDFESNVNEFCEHSMKIIVLNMIQRRSTRKLMVSLLINRSLYSGRSNSSERRNRSFSDLTERKKWGKECEPPLRIVSLSL